MKNFTLLFAGILFWGGNAVAQNFQTHIEANNVRAQIVSEGLLFNDFANGFKGGFEAPKLPMSTANRPVTIFASTLWLGGTDPGGNLHVAAQTYRQTGNDYIAGPLDPGTKMPVTGKNFDTLWHINKADIDALHSGIITPNVANWPGTITTSLGKHTLAPFWDKNSNGTYDAGTDEPIFPGDEAVFFVYNDKTLHAETNGLPLNVEIKGFMYQYVPTGNEFLNNTVFVDYTITNYGDRYWDFTAGVWTDFDLGNFADDYVGTDTVRNMYYAYNGNDTDKGALGYGANPPAMGVIFLNQKLHSAIAYKNDFTVMGNPTISNHYEYYMAGVWKDGSAVTYGGNGHNSGGQPVRYMYPGNPCTNTGWTESLGGQFAGDRRLLGSTWTDIVETGAVKKITVAYLWARSNAGGAIPSLCKLFSQTDSLKDWHDKQFPLGVKPVDASEVNVRLYPNPASGMVQVDIPVDMGNNIVLEVYDISGRKVITTTEKTFNVSALAKGLYIVRGEVGEMHFSQKLVVE